LAWQEFRRGKQKKLDVQIFEQNLIENLLSLHEDLRHQTYEHGAYYAFKINDPKPRDIHKATVRDRVLHHALYRSLAPFFFPAFIADSYSCQLGKGTHRALERFSVFARKVSDNNTRQCFILKCDIKKFFASIDHAILFSILHGRIGDEQLFQLLRVVVDSFDSGTKGKGLPLGNLTSQLLVNIYMHEFDVYIKQTLKIKYYIRYADDFVIFDRDCKKLTKTFQSVERFLFVELALEMHPQKISIGTLSSGIDFLGWVHFPHHKVLRTVTKLRMFRKISANNITSYTGMLGHGNSHKILSKLSF
jgi:retron-type reverse transcriptase